MNIVTEGVKILFVCHKSRNFSTGQNVEVAYDTSINRDKITLEVYRINPYKDVQRDFKEF